MSAQKPVFRETGASVSPAPIAEKAVTQPVDVNITNPAKHMINLDNNVTVQSQLGGVTWVPGMSIKFTYPVVYPDSSVQVKSPSELGDAPSGSAVFGVTLYAQEEVPGKLTRAISYSPTSESGIISVGKALLGVRTPVDIAKENADLRANRMQGVLIGTAEDHGVAVVEIKQILANMAASGDYALSEAEMLAFEQSLSNLQEEPLVLINKGSAKVVGKQGSKPGKTPATHPNFKKPNSR